MDINQLIGAIQNEYQKGDLEKALSFSRSLGSKIANIPNAIFHYAICLFFEGRILVDQNDLNEAENVLEKGLKIYEDNNRTNDGYYLMTSLALADAYFKSYKNDKSSDLYGRVLNSSLYGNDLSLRTKVFHKYAVIAERNRDYKKAITHYEEYLRLFSQLHNDQAPTYLEFYRYKEKLKLALKAKEMNYQGGIVDSKGLINGKFDNGDAVIMDIKFAQYLVSELPNPQNEDIEKLLVESAYIQREVNGEKEIFKLNDINKNDLLKYLTIKEVDGGHEMNFPNQLFTLIDNNSNEITRIDYFDKGVIRMVDKWKPDAILINKEGLVNWFKKN